MDINTKLMFWSEEKNEILQKTRGISFEDIVTAIEYGNLISHISHPNPKYSYQYILIVEVRGYTYDVPYVIEGNTLFLKTIHPNRKNLYLLQS